MDKYLERFHLGYNKKQINKISNLKILVIGLGGVGGYTCESLCRCGIKELVIMDNDIINESNLNRQIIATKTSIGKYKVEALKERLESISNTKITCINDFYNQDSNYIDSSFDFVVDACDTITSKLSIIKKCLNLNINFISCLGTGNRKDPTKIKIEKLNKTNYCPVAKILRKLIKEHNINDNINVLWSYEQPFKQRKVYNINEKISKKRIPIASNSFVPACAGLIITSYIIDYFSN